MKNILYIGNRLQNNNNTVTTIDTLSAKLIEEGYTVNTYSSEKNQILRLLDMCRAVIKLRKKVDIVLIDTYSTLNFYYAFTIARLCIHYKLDYIPILHGGDLQRRLQNNKYKSDLIFNNSKVNIAPSLFLYEAFEDKGYSNIKHIPNSLEIENYPFKIRKTLRPKLLWVRSFSEIYNPLMALEVLLILTKTYPDATLTMVGPEKDASLSKCKHKAEALNLPVTFTGKLEKKEWIDLAEGFDIFINTTNFDNAPVSVIEAMALGLVVVSTNVGGIPFLLKEGKDAVLTEPGNAAQMAEKIKLILNDPGMGVQLTINARKKAQTYDWLEVKCLWNEVLR